MSVTFTSLLIVEAVLTGAAVLMFVYRGFLDLKEEDRLVLSDAESHLSREQAGIRQKVNVLGRYLTVVSIVWCLLAVVLFGLWVVEGLNLV
jgi:hypothetical protein